MQPEYIQQTVDGAVAIYASPLNASRTSEVISTRSETLDILLGGGFLRGRIHLLGGATECHRGRQVQSWQARRDNEIVLFHPTTEQKFRIKVDELKDQ